MRTFLSSRLLECCQAHSLLVRLELKATLLAATAANPAVVKVQRVPPFAEGSLVVLR